MAGLTGLFFVLNGKDISIEEFRERCLAPFCGTRQSYEVLQQFTYCVSACHGSSIARERLERQGQLGFKYIEYNYLGVQLLVRCNHFDEFCEIIIVEYGKAPNHPP